MERERARASLRIIPARAGFTPAPTATPPQDEDHPRSRGVYRSPDLTADTKDGSSPLARGLLGEVLTIKDIIGIIPARAGFTYSRRRRTRVRKDHPRSRGVYELSHLVCSDFEGSSPLARGLRKRVTRPT